MKKSTVMFYIFCAVMVLFFIASIFSQKDMRDKTYFERPISKEATPTINYYLEDLYAQCDGIKYFDNMIEQNETLLINENFKKEYQKTLDYIERDKKFLEMDDFKCPKP